MSLLRRVYACGVVGVVSPISEGELTRLAHKHDIPVRYTEDGRANLVVYVTDDSTTFNPSSTREYIEVAIMTGEREDTIWCMGDSSVEQGTLVQGAVFFAKHCDIGLTGIYSPIYLVTVTDEQFVELSELYNSEIQVSEDGIPFFDATVAGYEFRMYQDGMVHIRDSDDWESSVDINVVVESSNQRLELNA